jgi:hypothetical protein
LNNELETQHGTPRGIPVLVREGAAFPLTPAPLGQGAHGEVWLQGLVQAHPQLLPVAQIEPGCRELIAAAREAPCGHGFIDNLFVTPAGDIAIAEVKLWRNPQMRRKAQARKQVPPFKRPYGSERFISHFELE